MLSYAGVRAAELMSVVCTHPPFCHLGHKPANGTNYKWNNHTPNFNCRFVCSTTVCEVNVSKKSVMRVLQCNGSSEGRQRSTQYMYFTSKFFQFVHSLVLPLSVAPPLCPPPSEAQRRCCLLLWRAGHAVTPCPRSCPTVRLSWSLPSFWQVTSSPIVYTHCCSPSSLHIDIIWVGLFCLPVSSDSYTLLAIGVLWHPAFRDAGLSPSFTRISPPCHVNRVFICIAIKTISHSQHRYSTLGRVE